MTDLSHFYLSHEKLNHVGIVSENSLRFFFFYSASWLPSACKNTLTNKKVSVPVLVLSWSSTAGDDDLRGSTGGTNAADPRLVWQRCKLDLVQGAGMQKILNRVHLLHFVYKSCPKHNLEKHCIGRTRFTGCRLQMLACDKWPWNVAVLDFSVASPDWASHVLHQAH